MVISPWQPKLLSYSLSECVDGTVVSFSLHKHRSMCGGWMCVYILYAHCVSVCGTCTVRGLTCVGGGIRTHSVSNLTDIVLQQWVTLDCALLFYSQAVCVGVCPHVVCVVFVDAAQHITCHTTLTNWTCHSSSHPIPWATAPLGVHVHTRMNCAERW